MTNTRRSTATLTESEATTDTAPTEGNRTVVGPALRHGQAPEEVTFAHHLRIAGRNYQPGQKAFLSPDYARQLRGNGYIARGRA